MRLSDENLQGLTVITACRQAIGSIKAVPSMQPTRESSRPASSFATISRIRSFGADRSMFHRGLIELPVALVQSGGDAVAFGVAIDASREAHWSATPVAR